MSVQAQEQQRHQWLEAIGIDSWLPRQPLPGAAAPADWVADFRYPQADGAADFADYEDSAAEASLSGPAQGAAPARKPGGGSGIDTQALLGDIQTKSAPKPQPKPHTPPPAASADPAPAADAAAPAAQKPVEPAPHFKLAYLVRGDLLIIDSLPPHHREGFSRQHKRLLQGITTALGLTAEQELSDPAMLPWPMLASKTLDQGPTEARLAVEHKLKRTLEFRPDISRILLLGDAAMHWVTGEPFKQGALPSLSGRTCVASISLSELLRLPERKAELWQDIQPIRNTVS
ncbi:hypothetical protein [Marinobacterium stanieri]|uniref:hypothetical protein n=1 Tax=Marinobacterium stanieri TaxID=49186 RepID=UPI000255A60D|nr:hypothetical protein [Marinobacterium stanieri]